ncbi:hypothetical protein KAX08_09350 [candidate division WOR-3 bacterium]|nr:hypothetical protein [candidate division WOR-3 bacterium]
MLKFKKDNGTLVSILLLLIATMMMMWIGLGSKIYQNEQHLYKIQVHTLELLQKQEEYHVTWDDVDEFIDDNF